MHHHGYAWLGAKQTFDKESVRRPPGPPPAASSPPDVLERYRQAVIEFPTTDVPPIQTAHWLMKPASMVRGTWEEPNEAGEWLGHQLTSLADRFTYESDRRVTESVTLVNAAVERLSWGGDVSLGHYLTGMAFHSVALVTCSSNLAAPEVNCPLQ
ncbi:hypothetical protein OG413_14830 [Streptomyces sp. NBC_01433]|nr:hypothetical protein [Streptomyces sp. NBC_01433]